MVCSECGTTAAAMPTVYWPEEGDDAEEWPLCPSCFAEVAGEVLIVPGPVAGFGRCSGCSEWFSVRELVDVKAGAGGRGDAPGGTCHGCALPTEEIQRGGPYM